MKLLHLLKNIFYSLVIFLGLMKSLAFALAIYAEHNITTVESWFSQAMGAPIHFKHIETAWTGVTPSLWLKAFSIGDQEVMQLGDVLVGVDLRALGNWRTNLPVFLRLTGMRVQLLREVNGETRVVGLISRTGGTLSLPAHIHIQDAVLEWKDLKHRNVELALSDIDLHLRSQGKKSQLSIELANEQGELQMRADITGDPLGTQWSADAYIRTNAFQATELVTHYLPEHYQLDDFTLNLQAWSQWRQGVHSSTRGRLELAPFRLAGSTGESIDVNRLSTQLNYVREQKEWRAQLTGLNMQIDDKIWPSTDLAARMTSLDAGNWRIDVGVGHISLDSLSHLLTVRAPAKHIGEVLEGLSPRGSWHNLRGSLVRTGEHTDWSLAADFEAFGMQAWKRLPGLSNLSGHIKADRKRVHLDMYSTDAAVFLPRLFRTPLPISLLRGAIDWRSRADGGWVLEGHNLTAESADLKTLSRLKISTAPDQSLFLDIQSDFRDGRGENAGTYYPVGIMSNHLVEWLDRSVVAGKVPSGSFILRGPLKGFPYHQSHDGHFEVLFDAQDVTLDYLPEWPPLTQVDARVRFHNNALSISSRDAAIYDSKVWNSTAHIPSLKPIEPIQISGTVQGPLSDQLRLLRETPLQKRFGHQLENIVAEGSTLLTTDFSIPLGNQKDYEFQGVVSLQDATLKMEAWDLQLSHIAGDLLIDLNGIFATAIKATALGEQIQLDISPTEDNSIQIDARGELGVDSIFRQLPTISTSAASGRSDFAIVLDIPNTDAGKKPRLGIYSDLQGISLEMPNPLKKQAADVRQLSIDMPLGQELKEISVQYDEAVRLAVAPTGETGHRLSGTIDSLALTEWMDYFRQQPQSDESRETHITNVDLFFDSIDAGIISAKELALVAHHNDAGWFGYTDSKNIAGSFSIPDNLDTEPVKLDIDHLDLTITPSDDDETTQPGAQKMSPDPGKLPALRIKCDQLNVNKFNLGSILLDARKTSDGLKFSNIRLNGDLVEIKAQGDWRRTADGSLTRMMGDFSTPDLGELLDALAITSGIEGANTTINFDLNWPDAPFQPAREHLSGDLQFDVAAGRFLDIEPGATRVFGLFNFAALQRRLKLDFSDLFKKGLSFDFIQADFMLEEGQAYTNNMVILGPSGRIGIAGRTGLAASDFDQLVTVTPRLGAALPLAGTLVGGPVAGLAVLVAQQLVTTSLKPDQGIQYSVQGTWDAPVIKKVTRRPGVPESASDSVLEELQKDVAPSGE